MISNARKYVEPAQLLLRGATSTHLIAGPSVSCAWPLGLTQSPRAEPHFSLFPGLSQSPVAVPRPPGSAKVTRALVAAGPGRVNRCAVSLFYKLIIIVLSWTAPGLSNASLVAAVEASGLAGLSKTPTEPGLPGGPGQAQVQPATAAKLQPSKRPNKQSFSRVSIKHPGKA